MYGKSTGSTIETGGVQTVYAKGTAEGTTIKQYGILNVKDGGKATGVKQEEGAVLIATTGTGTVIDGTNALGKPFSIKEGQADNVLLENGGQLTVVNETTADHTTIRNGGKLIVNAGGTATGTTIDNGGLMQNAGEDSGTTVKDGGGYELGRYNASSTVKPDYRYYGTAAASGLKVEAGGRAEVYAGTLTGAKVSGANASLTLMTPQTETDGSDLTLSLTGQVSVTEGGRLVVTGTAEGSHRVYVADTGKSPEAGTDLTLVTTGGGDAAFVLGNEGGMVDIGTYEYTLKKDTDNTGGNS